MKKIKKKNIIVSKEFLMGHCIRYIIMQTVHENILIQHSIVPNQNLQCHFLPTVSSAVSNWVTSRGYDRREAAEMRLLTSFQTRFLLVLLIKPSSRTSSNAAEGLVGSNSGRRWRDIRSRYDLLDVFWDGSGLQSRNRFTPLSIYCQGNVSVIHHGSGVDRQACD